MGASINRPADASGSPPRESTAQSLEEANQDGGAEDCSPTLSISSRILCQWVPRQ